MSDFSTEAKNIIVKYPKAIVHLRAQNKRKRLALMLGSGASEDFKIPKWKDLIKKIAEHEELSCGELYENVKDKTSLGRCVQMLYEKYRNTKEKELATSGTTPSGLEKAIYNSWTQLIKSILYQKAAHSNGKKIKDTHKYLGSFIEIIVNAPMTVNFNFDSFIEEMLAEEGKSYEPVWDPSLQFRNHSAVIYHPNGYLPKHPVAKPGGSIAFSEHEFADQLIASSTGYFATLSHHLSKYTSLLIGLSLDDSTLRHLLRQNAKFNPGNFHYRVEFIGNPAKWDDEQIKAIEDSDFEVYNLITLFLTSPEIKALGELIKMNDDDFIRQAREIGAITKYCYYVTGALGVGKSTAISFFRSLLTYEEWPDAKEMPNCMGKNWNDLTAKEKEYSNKWTREQFNKKNHAIKEEKEGILIIDRSPLDPIAFTKQKERPKKAMEIISAISPGQANRKVVSGHSIVLLGEPAILEERLRDSSRSGYDRRTLRKMQKDLVAIYPRKGTTKLPTQDLSKFETAKRVARIIYRDNYIPGNLHGRLRSIAKGKRRENVRN